MATSLPYDWNGRAGRFRDPKTGRWIARSEVRQWIDRDILASQNAITAASNDFRSGRIALDEWQALMRMEIKRVFGASELLLRGGRSQMTPADWGRVGQRVREQYAFLRVFAEDLRSGAIRTDGGFLNRARMYAASARAAFHAGLSELLGGLGYQFEKNELHPAEHCGGCLVETARGWVRLGELVPIGQRDCLSNDRCSVLFK